MHISMELVQYCLLLEFFPFKDRLRPLQILKVLSRILILISNAFFTAKYMYYDLYLTQRIFSEIGLKGNASSIFSQFCISDYMCNYTTNI